MTAKQGAQLRLKNCAQREIGLARKGARIGQRLKAARQTLEALRDIGATEEQIAKVAEGVAELAREQRIKEAIRKDAIKKAAIDAVERGAKGAK